jgi:hypothetical protein
MADKVKDNSTVWFVRGVDLTLRADVAEAARRAGMKVGPWVERALRTAIAASGGDPMADLARRLAAVEARLAKLGQEEATTVEEGVPVDALETLEVMEGPTVVTEARSGGRQKRRPWTAEEDAAIKRIAGEGGTQADAVRELQRPSSIINVKWRSLGLPVEPRKGRKLGPYRTRPRNQV